MNLTELTWPVAAGLLITGIISVSVLTVAAAWLFGTPMDREEIQDTFHRFLDANHKERE